MKSHSVEKKLKKILKIGSIILGLFLLCLLIIKFFNWLNQNAGGVQAISTTVLVFVTIYFAWKTYRLQRLQLKQIHSRRIAEEIDKILEGWNPLGINIKNCGYGEEKFKLFYNKGCEVFSNLSNLSDLPTCAREHLESGYKESYEKYKNWVDEGKSFLEEFEKFVECSIEELNKSINELRSERDKVYEYAIITYCIQKILDDYPDEPKVIKEGEDIIEVRLDKIIPEVYLMKGKPALWEGIKERFMKKFLNFKKEKVLEFSKESEKLKNEGDEIIDEIRWKVVDVGRNYGLIKGKCRGCDE